MHLFYMSRFYSNTVRFICCVCVRNSMENCSYGPNALRLIFHGTRQKTYSKKECMK